MPKERKQRPVSIKKGKMPRLQNPYAQALLKTVGSAFTTDGRVSRNAVTAARDKSASCGFLPKDIMEMAGIVARNCGTAKSPVKTIQQRHVEAAAEIMCAARKRI